MPSTDSLADPQEYQKIFHWAETQKDGTIPSFNTRRNDPYEVFRSPSSTLARMQLISRSIKPVSVTSMYFQPTHLAIQHADEVIPE
jgi:hypothetical protein